MQGRIININVVCLKVLALRGSEYSSNYSCFMFHIKTTLCKWSQVRFRGSPAGWKLKPSSKKVVCPPLEPGQEGDISITFTAPSKCFLFDILYLVSGFRVEWIGVRGFKL